MSDQNTTSTACPYCGVGCGVLVSSDGGGFSVRGDPGHPSNLGRLCSKGAALADTLDLDGRLLSPQIRGRQADWGETLDEVANGFRRVVDEHGPDAVAFYVSGQLLTEDYYVANKLMKGFIGSANIDTNSRLCMSSAVAGYKRAFGADTVPCCYEDLESADLLVLVGSNTAWCHPVIFQRISAARKKRPQMRIVTIDPRRTATADIADMQLSLNPGTDAALFNGLLNHLAETGEVDDDYLTAHVEGHQAALALASQWPIARVAEYCGLQAQAVADFYDLFARRRKVVSLYSQGINQWSSGTDRVNSIINCHLLCGRLGEPGMGPFSMTGQPNAMGGREVGGLANTLAAHMDFDDASCDRVGRFWGSDRVARQPGLKAMEIFAALETGAIKAIWIMGTNPIVSLPDANRARAALQRCPLVVVSDCMQQTDTTACADILLPATTWGEKAGTVTNSERRISRQRAFLPAPGEARPDWWIVTEVARRMGFADAFGYERVSDIFREHARLSGFENDGRRDFDISALADISDADYEALAPVQWPVNAAAPAGTARLLANGRFYTASGRASILPIEPRPPAGRLSAEFPLVLNTGRTRDQWHTMTRTGKSARLANHRPEPFMEIHNRDAAPLGLTPGGLCRIRSVWGEMLARVVINQGHRRGTVFVPMHWNEQYASHGRVGALVNPAVDPVSGQPEFKHTPVRVEAFEPAWHGFVLSSRQLPLAGHETVRYWVRINGKRFIRYELAGDQSVEDWSGWARSLLCADGQQVEWLDYLDTSSGRYRAARLVANRLESCLFIGPSPELPAREWLAKLFTAATLSDSERLSLLSGRPPKGSGESGRLVCSCFGVGENVILDAIIKKDATTVEGVGKLCQAGTNCGSCIPEIRSLIEAAR